MKKPDVPIPSGKPDGGQAVKGEWAAKYPHLYEFMTCVRWEDGERRETGTLMIFCEGTMWKAQVRDRALQRALWRTGNDMDECLVEADEALGRSDCGDWRPFQPQPGQKRRR